MLMCYTIADCQKLSAGKSSFLRWQLLQFLGKVGTVLCFNYRYIEDYNRHTIGSSCSFWSLVLS
jgi:hypothetical protein